MVASLLPLLTTGTGEPGLFRALLPWLLLILAGIIGGGAIIYAARRLLQPSRSDDTAGFTLQSLRELHAAGQISDEEFERARKSMIEQVQRAAKRDEEAGSARSSPAPRKASADKQRREPRDDAADNDGSNRR